MNTMNGLHEEEKRHHEETSCWKERRKDRRQKETPRSRIYKCLGKAKDNVHIIPAVRVSSQPSPQVEGKEEEEGRW